MIGMRINTPPAAVPQRLVAALGAIPTAILSDNMGRLASGGAGLRPWHGAARLMGRALTVRTRPGDNLLVHKAVETALPGDVLAIDAGGDLTNAIIGEILMRLAAKRGVVGFAVDGAIRDLGAFIAADFPVFARGVTHRGPYKDGPGELNVPVRIGEMVVHPGDILVGDEDGLVAVPPTEASEILSAAQQQVEREAAILRSIEDGTVDRSWVDATLREKGYDL